MYYFFAARPQVSFSAQPLQPHEHVDLPLFLFRIMTITMNATTAIGTAVIYTAYADILELTRKQAIRMI